MTQRFYVDADGAYLGAYDGPDEGNPFAGATEAASPPPHGGCVWSGGAWVSTTTHRAVAKAAVDAAAEAARLAYVTPGSGQALVYREKASEADRLAADPTPDPADYPILAASIGIEGADLQEVAARVTAIRSSWTVVAAQIEAVRLRAKSDIDALPADADPADVAAIVDALVWPSP